MGIWLDSLGTLSAVPFVFSTSSRLPLLQIRALFRCPSAYWQRTSHSGFDNIAMANERSVHHDEQDFAPDAERKDLDEASQNSQPKGSDLELGTRATYINTGAAAGLSQEHRDYLLQRHGTLELDPMPTMDPADPYNWPQWKKTANLLCVAFHVRSRSNGLV